MRSAGKRQLSRIFQQKWVRNWFLCRSSLASAEPDTSIAGRGRDGAACGRVQNLVRRTKKLPSDRGRTSLPDGDVDCYLARTMYHMNVHQKLGGGDDLATAVVTKTHRQTKIFLIQAGRTTARLDWSWSSSLGELAHAVQVTKPTRARSPVD